MKLSSLKLESLAIEASWAEAPNLEEISMKRAFAWTVEAASATLVA
jgi:hypothetical protein